LSGARLGLNIRQEFLKNSEDHLRGQSTHQDRGFLNPEKPFSQIGGGELGGKANGLFSIRNLLKSEIGPDKHPEIHLDIPSLAVIGTDVFDDFMQSNHLDEIAHSDQHDSRITQMFQKANLPFEVLGDLRALVNQVQSPLAIRSSSLLEDSRSKPFAGVYATKMVPNNNYNPDIRFQHLIEAIKFVYASTFSQNAKDYRTAIGHGVEDEKMAVIIQEVVGKRYHKRFYPELSGVARSYNYYPMGSARPEDGIVSLALGLGKTIVDGGRCWSYSPVLPKIQPPFGSIQELLKETQTEFWAVNMGEPLILDPSLETEYLLLENLTIAERDDTLQLLVSTYSPLSNRLSVGMGFEGPRALTFAPILVLEKMQLNGLICDLLEVCSSALNTPVEIEFAMTFNPYRLGFLQVRALEEFKSEIPVVGEELVGENVLVATENALGNGIVDCLYDVVYTKPESFSLKHTSAIVPELEHINRKLLNEGRPYLLIVLGRLGTTDPWLGIPINWGKISGARVVVEATQDNVRVELSQGSHFFHNIMSLGVLYFTLPINTPYHVDWEWLRQQPVVEETTFLSHVKLAQSLQVKVDGRVSRGVIYHSMDCSDE
jgi:hypothetical protein